MEETKLKLHSNKTKLRDIPEYIVNILIHGTDVVHFPSHNNSVEILQRYFIWLEGKIWETYSEIAELNDCTVEDMPPIESWNVYKDFLEHKKNLENDIDNSYYKNDLRITVE